MAKKIQIILIEDNRLLRDGIAKFLKVQSDMQLVATVSNGENVLSLIEKNKPNIILLDLGLRNKNSLQLVKSVKQHYPETKIIVMDLVPLQSDVLEFVQAGASGFILKDSNIAEFLNAIRLVNQGMNVLPPNLTGSLFSQIIELATASLKISEIVESVLMTKREQEVIALIAEGFTNKEIAQQVHLSIFTIKSHIHNILEKLNLHNRVEVANYSYSNLQGNKQRQFQ